MSGRAGSDVDRSSVISGLRSALSESALSQAAFAKAIGTSPSRLSTYLTGRSVPSASLYLRALRLARALREAAEQSWLTPIVAVRQIRDGLADGDRVWPLRLTLQSRDDLRRVLDSDLEHLAAAWGVDPGSSAAEDWDRLLAGVIGHEFEARRLPPPAWTAPPVDDNDQWLMASPFFSPAEIRSTTPSWLADRGLFIAARDLVTV